MCPLITVFGKAIPSYWLCVLIGALACCGIAVIRCKQFRELQKVDITNSAALILIGALLGSRLLYLICISPIIVRHFDYLLCHPKTAYDVISNGMVFYGGLFGAIAALHLYSKRFGLDETAFFAFYAPLFPLFHAFGRMGCFLTGCCHGIVSARFGIAFSNSMSAENGVPFFPVQLLCAGANLSLFLLLCLLEKRPCGKQGVFRFYLWFYAIGRFFVEFLRGDTIRGIIGGLSTSQWISIALLIGLITTGICSHRKKAVDNDPLNASLPIKRKKSNSYDLMH